jgi:hypothetical protein
MPKMQTTSDSDILSTYKKIQDQYGPSTVKDDPFAAQTQAVRSATEDVGNRQTADAEAREQGLKALLSSREGRIKEREGRIQGSEDLNTKMAIINAGLAMMQSTGKGLAGIAEGATVGAKQYAEGMKASELARQKIEDARDAFDELRFNQEGMTAKEKTAAYATIKNGAITAENTFVKNVQHQQGITKDQAHDLFDSTVRAKLEKDKMQNQLALEGMQQAGANARAKMLSGDARIASILGAGGKQAEELKKGIEELSLIQTGKFNVPTEYSKYLQEWVKSGGVAGPKMSMAEFAGQFGRVVTQPGPGSRQ